MNRKLILATALPFLLIILVSSKDYPDLNLSVLQEEESLVKWMSFEEALEKSKTEKRKIFIDVYTDWCGWCKVMDKKTFSEANVGNYLNDNFYPVKLDAEQRGEIKFKDYTYKFIPNGSRGYHELAAALLQGKLSYPTVVFLDEDFNLIQPLPGYREAKEFHPILTYFGDNLYKQMAWKDYQSVYESPYN